MLRLLQRAAPCHHVQEEDAQEARDAAEAAQHAAKAAQHDGAEDPKKQAADPKSLRTRQMARMRRPTRRRAQEQQRGGMDRRIDHDLTPTSLGQWMSARMKAPWWRRHRRLKETRGGGEER